VLDLGAEGPGIKISVMTLSGNSPRQTVHQAAKLKPLSPLKGCRGNCRSGRK